MLFTRKRTNVHDIDIEINNITISRVKNVKFLGVILDEKMSWKDHINYISKKISKCIAIMFKLKKYSEQRYSEIIILHVSLSIFYLL